MTMPAGSIWSARPFCPREVVVGVAACVLVVSTSELLSLTEASAPRSNVGNDAPCQRSDELKKFDVRFSYISQGARVVDRPRANRPFKVGYSVKASAFIRVTIRRNGRTLWSYPKKGTIRDYGALELKVPGLRRGEYTLALRAYSPRVDQKQCLRRQLIVRG